MIVNERLAHESGGEFIVRFDDTSSTVRLMPPHKVDAIIRQQRIDIEWLGIHADEYVRESRMEPIKPMNFRMDPLLVLPYSVAQDCIWYPYSPEETYRRVIRDSRMRISHVIRGIEFLTEYCLYMHLCETLNHPKPRFIFLPRLMGQDNEISKTNGGYTVAEYRGNGYSPHDIANLLERSCLKIPGGGWNLQNLRAAPRV
jgi:glutamyl/glutaminyl-tRNA synthetase